MDKNIRRNPILVAAIVGIALLSIVLVVSGWLLLTSLGSYSQRVAAPVATVAAALSTPAEPPTPDASHYDPSVTPVVTPLASHPGRARHDLILQVAPFADAPTLTAADGSPLTVPQGNVVTLIATTADGWAQVQLDSGTQGWCRAEGVEY